MGQAASRAKAKIFFILWDVLLFRNTLSAQRFRLPRYERKLLVAANNSYKEKKENYFNVFFFLPRLTTLLH